MRDELADPNYTRPRWLGEIAALLLVGLVIASCVYSTRGSPGPYTAEKGMRTVLGGAFFVLIGMIWIGSYFVPAWSVIFRFLAWCAENLPGTMGGRFGPLLMGGLFALLGFGLIVVGLGVFG